MTERLSHTRGGRLAAGVVLLMTVGPHVQALAQQPKAGAAPSAPAAAPAPPQSAWVKICEPTPQPKVGPDGRPQVGPDKKPVLENKTLCMTNHEQMSSVGVTLVSAAIQQLEGIDKMHMMVMVPPNAGLIMPAGMSVIVYSKEQVEKLQRREKLEEKDLTGQNLMFTVCQQGGCTAENEATPQLVAAMKTGHVMMAYATHVSGQPIPFELSLNGFQATFEGKPVDNEVFKKQRERLFQIFMANRMEAMKQARAQISGGQQTPTQQQAGGPAKAPAAQPAKK